MAVLSRLFILILLCLPLAAAPVAAQQVMPGASASADPAADPEPLPEPLTKEAINEMVAQMSDDEVRALLLERLDAVAETGTGPAEPAPTVFQRITTTAQQLGASWLNVLHNVPNLVSAQALSFRNFADRFQDPGLVMAFGLVALVLAISFGIEMLVRLLVKRWQRKETGHEGDDLWSAVSYLFRRFCRELLGLVAFYVALRLIGRNFLSPDIIAFAAPLVFYLILFPRVGAALSRFILAPNRSDLRLVNVNDQWSQYLHRNLIGLFFLIGFTMFIVGFNAMNGVPMGETRLGFWLNTAVHLYIILIAWTAREGLVDMMRGTDPDRTEFDEKVARAYPWFAIVVSAVMWLIVEIIVAKQNPELLLLLGQGPHYTTMFWLLMAPAIDTLIRGLVRHLLPPMIGEGKIAEDAYKATKRSYIRIGRVFAGAFVILMIAAAWNIDLRGVAAEGGNVGAALIQFLILAAFGYIFYESASLWFNRKLTKEMTAAATPDQEAGEGGGAGGSRLATVLPLMRVTAQVAIAVIFGLLAIGSLGIDIAPLLAGAGILGLAIGFGAQKLVSDIVSGVFFLIDDAFRVGEYVDVGGTAGTVEKISIRSMQLRHHRGAVHTIPYGEIQKLTNYSRDWVIMKLKFTVPFDTDPNKVKKIFKKIGTEMMEDPTHGPGFIEPFKSQGVFDFDDVGMIIRGKFMAKPGQQFTIRKEIYNRVKKQFEEAGIPFARREVRVAIPGLEDNEELTEEDKAKITGAAAAAAAQDPKNPA